jgi:hypothetical protein
MAHARVATDQDELPQRRTRARLFQQPEQALDRDVHDRLWRFLASREMQHVRHARHRLDRDRAIADRAAHHPEVGGGGQRALVT